MKLFTRRFILVSLLLVSRLSASAQLTASFTEDFMSGCAPLVVHFTNTSTGASGYHWNFGNGTTSVLTNASTSYLTPGSYVATLTAYSGTDSTVHSVTITVYPSPTVSFVASDTTVCPGAPVSFVSTSSPGVSGPETYSWNFGDGDSSNLATPSHAYTSPGYKNITLSVTNSQGCTASLTVGALIDVYTPSTPAFTGAPTYICNSGGTTIFTNGTSGTPPFSYEWEFGDGGTSTAADPSHTYGAPGSYNVTLIVTDGHGCTDSLDRFSYIYVGDLVAAFTYPATACIYSQVVFHNTSSPHTSSNWYFGDGGSSTVDSGVHAYNTAGTYTVTLVVNSGPCHDTVTHTITISPEPVSTFTWTPTEPCPAPDAITFTSGTPAGSTETWSFGDGGTGTGGSPTHNYASNGVDTVKMITTNSSGCKDTVTHVEILYDLHVDISHLIDSGGCAPLNINFLSYAITNEPDSVPVTYPYGVSSYTWTFGDGSSSSSGATPAHTFTAAGVYTVTVHIVTGNGCTALATKIIRVGVPPVASFSAAPTHVCADHSVMFTNLSTGADSYAWTFGDSSGSTATNPIHLYQVPDSSYTVRLIALYNGCPDTFIIHNYITVDSPEAIIEAAYLCIPDNAVAFTDTSLGDDTHLWIFGDGTTSTVRDPTHTYPALTAYTVTLTTYNIASGCRDTAHRIVNLVKPVLHFTASDTAMCPGTIVHFYPTITGGSAEDYYWTINGVSPATTHDSVMIDTFNVPGLYSVQFMILDQDGCFDTVSKNNYIIVGKPAAHFTVAPPAGCWPLDAVFTDASTDVTGTTLTNYKWTFGDGATSSTSAPTTAHIYTSAGTFSVQEIVTDNIGCKDTVISPSVVTVYKPAASFYAGNVYPCIGTTVSFTNLSTGITGSFWLFGDGTTSVINSPTHVYSATGTYTVKLVVTDVHGCTDTLAYSNYINVTKPVASFYMTDSFSLCPPLEVSFINTSTGATTSYQWYFGDGASSILVSPSDLYVALGVDTVMLIAKNTHGCPDTAIGHVSLFGGAGGFTYGPLSGCTPLTVNFNASISNVPNIIWDFADGTTTTASFSDTTSHVYTIPGAYVPKLILSDNTGCQSSSQGIDTIKVDGIKTGFTTVPDPICVNTNVLFKDTSSSYFSTITSWHWTFDATDTSDLQNPPYYYNTVGNFPVTLQVVDGWGCANSVTEDVNVFPSPVITVSPDTTVCVGDPAQIKAYGGVSYTWAPPATVACPACAVTAATPAAVTQYTVTGTDAHGCVNTDTLTVHLRTNTISNGWGDTAVCRGAIVPLFDTGGTKYTWIPSTGLNNPTAPDPLASPAATTNYTVVAQLGGCIPDTNYVTVTVNQLPTVNAGPDQSLVAGSTAQLQATGTLIAKYDWLPAGSLSCSTCANPVASMLTTTTYEVDVTSSFGCRNSDSVTIHVFCDKSQIFIPNSFTPNGDGQNDVFYPRGTGISQIKAFRIYNRWGELLFERSGININDVSNAWDGTYNGGSPRADVYVYIIDAVCETGEPINLKGDVTIIR